jgi:hypothetical protein
MATNAYMTNRRKYSRPQAMLWANNPGSTVNGFYIPSGFEVGQTKPTNAAEQDLLNEFLILSDDNRAPLQFNSLRIEKKERMINGRMRSYHVADKLEISTSWSLLPSRSFSDFPGFDEFGRIKNLVTSVDHDKNPATPNKLLEISIDHDKDPATPNKIIQQFSGSAFYKDQQYTTDGGAGGVDILDWYNSYKGSFYVYLAYDKYTNFSSDDPDKYSRLGQYNEILEMYISNLSYSVEKRGGSNHDLWNISVSLEEA